MLTSDFNYDLPRELIAQEPLAIRSASRMMVLQRATGTLEHRSISDLPSYLTATDLLVLNNTRVFPARVIGGWEDSGGRVELLLLRPVAGGEGCCWHCICAAGRRVRRGLRALFAHGQLTAEILDRNYDGSCTVVFHSEKPLMEILEEYGRMPVPPYIARNEGGSQAQLDRERYQTVYARETGAVAAPTAGLHFDDALFAALDVRGVARATVTLHVGPGTFRPVKSTSVEEHLMEAERYSCGAETARSIAACQARGGRVVAVGSTTVRTLESVASSRHGAVAAADGESELFIYPPYEFQVVDAMLTNFHLPQSTLIMMVSALAGRELILAAYREAVRERYRFFSYGDCMLIL